MKKHHRFGLICAFVEAHDAGADIPVYRTQFGEGTGGSFLLMGSIARRSKGMAVFDINQSLIDVVGLKDIHDALEIIGASECVVMGCTHEEFHDWLSEKEDDFFKKYSSAYQVFDALRDETGYSYTLYT